MPSIAFPCAFFTDPDLIVTIASLTGHKRGVWKVAFSPVDKCLASSSADRTVRLWSMADHSCLKVFEGHTASVLTVRFINKGKAYSHSLHPSNPSPSPQTYTLPLISIPVSIYLCKIFQGMQLISGSSDGLVRLWTIRSGECENTFDSHTDRVWAIATMTIPAKHKEGNGEQQERGEETGPATEEIFFSGGSDSKLIVWGDHTEREEKQRLMEAESTLLLEQQMQNDLRNKRYDKVVPLPHSCILTRIYFLYDIL